MNVDTSSDVKVHDMDQFFTVTDPGEMNFGFTSTQGDKSGNAVNFPEATTQPRTFRKKANVEIYLTTSSTISGTEVAYQDESIDFASASMINYYNNQETGAAETSGSWRSFGRYLLAENLPSPITTQAFVLGVYDSTALVYPKGDEIVDYTKTGLYRIILEPYDKKPDGTQLYLRTEITFP